MPVLAYLFCEDAHASSIAHINSKEILVAIIQMQIAFDSFVRARNVDGVYRLMALIIVVHTHRPCDVMDAAFRVVVLPNCAQQ